jgi:hypothetical protein
VGTKKLQCQKCVCGVAYARSSCPKINHMIADLAFGWEDSNWGERDQTTFKALQGVFFAFRPLILPLIFS